MNRPSLKKKLASNSYVPENAWLDLTSSWLIKDLERSYKTFPEKFGLSKVVTQLSKHLEQTKTSTDQSGRATLSAAQVLKDLNYTIPRLDPASDIQSSSKDYDTTKDSDGDEKPKVVIDDEGLKIPQGTSHRNKKKWKLMIVER